MKQQGELIVMGAGGHAAVVVDTAVAAGFVMVGVLDRIRPDVAASPPFGGVPWLGDPTDPRETLEELLQRGARVHAAVGDADLRRRWLGPHLERAATIVHPTATVSPSAELGSGCFVGPRAVINARARVGVGVIVNTGSIVEHDVRIGAFTHLAPASIMLGESETGEEALVGGGAVVLPGVSVATGATLGAGAVAARDVAAGTVARGVPARSG